MSPTPPTSKTMPTFLPVPSGSSPLAELGRRRLLRRSCPRRWRRSSPELARRRRRRCRQRAPCRPALRARRTIVVDAPASSLVGVGPAGMTGPPAVGTANPDRRRRRGGRPTGVTSVAWRLPSGSITTVIIRVMADHRRRADDRARRPTVGRPLPRRRRSGRRPAARRRRRGLRRAGLRRGRRGRDRPPGRRHHRRHLQPLLAARPSCSSPPSTPAPPTSSTPSSPTTASRAGPRTSSPSPAATSSTAPPTAGAAAPARGVRRRPARPRGGRAAARAAWPSASDRLRRRSSRRPRPAAASPRRSTPRRS